MSKAKIAVLAAAVTGMAAGPVLAAAAPAHAVSCSSSGIFTAAVRELSQDIGYNGPRTVKLQLVNIRSSDYSYAFLTGAGGTGVQRGDSVWVEWKNTSTSPWEKCPASTAATDATAAVRSTGAHNINHPMRACLSYWATAIYRSTVCTGSFTDHPE
ncbi:MULTISPECIES: hypothetical protein [Nonomuraea]|uniref:Uncharacterized protein n=1 Tax=Nonomuraea ferruginea TaxID=46174 RepID=A0ABT4SQP1_9ACTN|nr:hypothetical protein [Nonomuraea ferruginea]MDA0639578.1 hypothetical protein [Nonomuraea ferruginea]